MDENSEEEKQVLTLNIDINAAAPKLKVAGYRIKLRMLHSSAGNWIKISKFIKQLNPETDIVLAKFTEYTLFKACLDDYASPLSLIIKEVKKFNHIIYIYDANLSGVFSSELREPVYRPGDKDIWDDIDSDDLFESNPFAAPLNKEIVDEILKPRSFTMLDRWCEKNGANRDIILEKMKVLVSQLPKELNIAPYRFKTDVELGASAFVDAQVRGLILRIYIPTERIWSSELEKVLRLFQDYAVSVQGQDVQLIQEHTESGTIYSIYSKLQKQNSTAITKLFDEFTNFMDLCQKNPDKARQLLGDFSIPQDQAQRLILKYTKEAKRLSLDIRQEAESKLLILRHRLESEISEASIAHDCSSQLGVSLSEASSVQDLIRSIPTAQCINLSITNQNIETVNGIVSSVIHGHIHYNEHDNTILELISKYAKTPTEMAELNSSLGIIKDASADQSKRTTAWQGIRSFLVGAADKVGDVGVNLLSKYLESVLMGSH